MRKAVILFAVILFAACKKSDKCYTCSYQAGYYIQIGSNLGYNYKQWKPDTLICDHSLISQKYTKPGPYIYDTTITVTCN